MTEKQSDRDWDRHDWAGEEHPADEATGKRWNDREWAGEEPKDESETTSEGESGLTGGGHTPSEQHWVPDKQ